MIVPQFHINSPHDMSLWRHIQSTRIRPFDNTSCHEYFLGLEPRFHLLKPLGDWLIWRIIGENNAIRAQLS